MIITTKVRVGTERGRMRRYIILLVIIAMTFPALAQAGLMDKAREYRERMRDSRGEPDTDTIIAGLKQALSIGAKNGVSTVSKHDGYFGNRLIRIPMPENLQKIERTLSRFGFQKEVDEFILSMNRAAEKAAPKALSFFIDAVKQMSIPDAVKILRGNDTAATEFLRSKTYEKIFAAFKPDVSSAMNDVGVTRAFKRMMDKTRSVPFLKKESVDLDRYVTSKALDGLFLMVGQEEKKIRKDPAARVTDLLKTVFK
jgi:RNA binding exosome subunit